MTNIVSLEGPVELKDGKFMLLIPLAAGGQSLSEVARGIGEIKEGNLEVTIPDWLVAKLGIREGCAVVVDNQNGKFNIRLAGSPAPLH